MKQKHFYSHLVETTDITLELAEMNLSKEERVHLLALIDANIHSVVINTVLSELSEEDKKIFLKNLVSNDNHKIWDHLKLKTEDLEEKIAIELEKLKKDFLKDIKETKNSRNP